MDKLVCLQLFIRVAQLGSFTAAANEFNTTQSAVSKKIAWLEAQIGLTLFHRHPRAIALTDSGAQYLKLAVKLTDELHSGESQLRKEQSSVSGKIKLSVPSSFSLQLLSSPLSEFMRLNAEVTFDISVSDKLSDLIEEDVDIAFRSTNLKDSGLKAKWLMDNELIYFASPDYLATHPTITCANDLIQHQCLSYSLSTPSNRWRFSNGDDLFAVKVNEYFRCDNPAMLVEMAKRGHGIAAMPKWMVEHDLQSNVLTQILTQYATLKLPMYMVFKDNEHQPMRIRSFIDFIDQCFRKNLSC